MITDRAQTRGSPRAIRPAQPLQLCSDETLTALCQHATTVRLRRRQLLPFSNGHLDSVYIVRSGLLALQTVLPGKPRQLLALHYPGDVMGVALPPPLPHAASCAIVASELWRLPTSTFESRLAEDCQLAVQITRHLARQEARTLLHAAMIGGLSGEERAASFLIELGLRAGVPSAHGMAFDMHLSRNDIADYLALNPDTLSRIMSRLKARGIVAQTGRTRAIVPNWEALCAESPLAGTLTALHSQTEG